MKKDRCNVIQHISPPNIAYFLLISIDEPSQSQDQLDKPICFNGAWRKKDDEELQANISHAICFDYPAFLQVKKRMKYLQTKASSVIS